MQDCHNSMCIDVRIDLPAVLRVMKEEEGWELLSAAEAYEARWAYPLNNLKAVISIVQVKLQDCTCLGLLH